MNEEAKKEVQTIIKEYLKTSSFTGRNLIDTPTDSLGVVNKRYVNFNGAVANRPKSSVASIGMSYFATDTVIPMTYNTTGWVNGIGSLVALNN